MRIARRQVVLVVLLLCALVVSLQIPSWLEARSHQHCLSLSDTLSVCAASDMARFERKQRQFLEHARFDLSGNNGLHLDIAKNETVAFQLVFRQHEASEPLKVRIDSDALKGEALTLNKERVWSQFAAWYHPAENAGFSYGADSDVLPWPGDYPDALVPQGSTCTRGTSHFDAIDLSGEARTNQAIWFDLYVPTSTPTGEYQSKIKIAVGQHSAVEIPISVQVWPVTLPETPTIDAIAELYRTYALEGASKDKNSAAWRQMAHCYQQLAHQHRMVFMERWDDLSHFDWETHRQYAGPILDGSLFTAERGYWGPGVSKPVSVWRTPWEQDFDRHIDGPLADDVLQQYQRLAQQWREEADREGWSDTDYFAYILDEVDGRTDEAQAVEDSDEYIRFTHTVMAQLQEALDTGTGDESIDLLWTSHSNPAQWAGRPGLDLAGTIRLWAPNASAADPAYLQQRKASGERIWFYHDGHPSVGAHSINASGIEMRSWGVISERYNFDGQFMWAGNLGQDEAPYRLPTYSLKDDRYGNGVIVYPGGQLDKIGYPAVAGPIPSMRMKAWRRGLQDAELARLARAAGHGVDVDEILQRLVPVALADALRDGHKDAQWSDDPVDWIDMRQGLLRLAARTE